MANPVIKLELMRRFRSPMAAWGIPLVVLLPGLAVITVYASSVRWNQIMGAGDEMVFGPEVDISQLQNIGRGMFGAVVGALMFTLLMLVPAIVGGSIAGERHSQTLQPLQLTAMTPTQIVAGKLVASLAYVVLAILCAAPVLVIPFMLGGLPATQVVATVVVMLLAALEFAAVSLAVSAIFSRPAAANVVSLLVCGFLSVAPFILSWILAMIEQTNDPTMQWGSSLARYVVAVSPISLGSWVIGIGDEQIEDLVTTADRLGSLFWFLAITALSLWLARAKVTAPVERDR